MTPTFIIILVALPLGCGLIAHVRRAAPWVLMAAVGVGWFAAALLCLFAPHVPGMVRLTQGNVDRAFHDTYYVIRHGTYLIWIAATVLLSSIVTITQTRAGAMRKPNLTRALFWIWLVGMLATISIGQLVFAFGGMPRRYIDYPAIYGRINCALTITALTAITALLALTILLIWSIWRTWQARQRG